MSAAQQLLDQARSVADIDALAADPARYATLLATELPVAASLAELEAFDASASAALGQIDDMVVRAMRLRLDHALAMDTSIGPPTRKVFASTIVSYATNLELLAQRACDVAARGGARDPDETARVVSAAAHSVLGLRDAVRAGVLELIRERAHAAIEGADRAARDRALDDAQRRRWSAARRELEAVASEPERVLAAPLEKRLAALPDQLDEPAPGPEVTFADLIELD